MMIIIGIIISMRTEIIISKMIKIFIILLHLFIMNLIKIIIILLILIILQIHFLSLPPDPLILFSS